MSLNILDNLKLVIGIVFQAIPWIAAFILCFLLIKHFRQSKAEDKTRSFLKNFSEASYATVMDLWTFVKYLLKQFGELIDRVGEKEKMNKKVKPVEAKTLKDKELKRIVNKYY